MKYGLVALLAIGLAVSVAADGGRRVDHHKSNSLKHNKTPKLGGTSDALESIIVRGQPVVSGEEDAVQARIDVCDDCVRVVQVLRTAVHDARKLEEVKSMLKLLCDMLSGEQVDECKSFIDNLDTIITRLDPFLQNPRLLCQQLELCDSPQTNVPRLLKLALKVSRRYLTNQRDDIVCDECVFVMNELKTVMAQKEAKDEVKAIFDQLCGYLGGTTAQRCMAIVDQYFPFIWDELVALLSDARGICVDLELCQRGQQRRTSMLRLLPALRREFSSLHRDLPQQPQTNRVTTALRFLSRLQTRDGDNVNCVLCKIGWTGIIDYLRTNNATLDRISDGMRWYVCQKVMPPSFGDGCNDFLQLYLKSVLLMTLEDVTPKEVCDAIHACTTNDLRKLRQMTPAQKSVVVCEACTVAAEFLQHEIRDRTVQDDIKQLVQRACQQLSGDMRAECNAMADTYLPAIFDSLVDELNPQTICPQLRMCSTRITVPVPEDN